MPLLEQTGTFRGHIVSYGLHDADSGAKSVGITVAVDEIWEEDNWGDWREYEMKVDGRLWVIKKDGSQNQRQIRALVDHAGWDGSFSTIAEGRWKPTPIQIIVEEDTYTTPSRYRISWVNAYDADPSGGGNISPEDAAALDQQYGPQIRALVGNVARNTPPADAGGPTKPVRGKSPQVANAGTQEPAKPVVANKDIPF